VENFRLESGIAESLQTIFAEGKISRESEEDFILEITALNMATLGTV
jgi:hypothetical protein